MSRHTCREESANAQNDGEQGENDRNAIAVRYIVNADSGCLAYPSASAGYREDCADNGASRQAGALELRWMHNPARRDGFIPSCVQMNATWYKAAGTDARKFLKQLGFPVFQKLWRTAFNAN